MRHINKPIPDGSRPPLIEVHFVTTPEEQIDMLRMLDEKLPVVVLATRDPTSEESRVLYEKTLSNIQEVKAREGVVLAVVTQGDREAGRLADHVIEVPACHDLLSPILEIAPLQLLAYHIAVRRGCDVDQPRNLAKSVTVE